MRAARRASVRRTQACQKIRCGAPGSPFSATRQLANLPDDEVALDSAKPVDEQRAVEMIHFVLEGTGQQAGSLVAEVAPLAVERFHDHARRPDHGGVEARDAEASLLFELHPFALDELRV